MNVYANQQKGYAKLVLVEGKIIPHKPKWLPQNWANLIGKLTNWTCYTVENSSSVRFNKIVDYKKTIIDHIVFNQYDK